MNADGGGASESGRRPGRGGRRPGRGDTFRGRAGPLAVMAELLHRGCNAAVPEVDAGTDVFAFVDGRPEVVLIQAKTCSRVVVYKDGSGYAARFALPLPQLRDNRERPPLYYALDIRRDLRWVDFVVVSRARLRGYVDEGRPFGSTNAAATELNLVVELRERVLCGGRDLTDCRNDLGWRTLPPLRPEASGQPAEAHGATAIPALREPPD